MKLQENKKRQDNLPFFTRRKRREFDDFLGFFAGSENPSVLFVHGFSGSAKTPKRRTLSPFYLKPTIFVKRTVKRREIDEVTRNKKPQDAQRTCRT